MGNPFFYVFVAETVTSMKYSNYIEKVTVVALCTSSEFVSLTPVVNFR